MNFYKSKSHWKVREIWIQKNTFYTLNMYIVGRFCSGTPLKCYAIGHRQLRNWSYIIMELGFFTITHHTHYFIHFSCSRREVGEITFLPSSSTSGCYSKKIVSPIFSLRIWEMNKIIGAVCHGKKTQFHNGTRPISELEVSNNILQGAVSLSKTFLYNFKKWWSN